jgi:hypothetical protein
MKPLFILKRYLPHTIVFPVLSIVFNFDLFRSLRFNLKNMVLILRRVVLIAIISSRNVSGGGFLYLTEELFHCFCF